MPAARAYRGRRRSNRSVQTRQKIVDAVRTLLAEGAFHEATVEEVADRAGIARATLYQHFRSRLDLIDPICDTFDANPALLRVRETVALDDADAALAETVEQCVRFWSSEQAILVQLYGVAAIDPAAQDLVDRQRADRRGEMSRLIRHLRGAGRLQPGLSERRALGLLMMLTAFETYRELRNAGFSDRELTSTLQQSASRLLQP
ncbi:MAG TPA: helix-turn-helix domain-containing protein [Solirubrobacteraceae bacterium]|nr:helix-turn-helix domain-containing protein [Solirubrobacteraceae bacterium]